MKFFALLALAAPLVSAFAQRNAPSFNPPADNLVPVTHANVVAAFPELASVEARDTNAHRLARGLPPLSPRALRKNRQQRTPTRVQHAARAGPSPTPTSGAIVVKDDSGNFLGYVSADLNIFGEYGITTDTSAVVAISASLPADGSQFDLTATTPSMSSLPFIGGTVGLASSDNDLSSGSFNYVYLSPLGSSTGAGSPPQANVPNGFTTATGIPEASESTLWESDATSGEISPTWINSNGSPASTQLAYYEPDNVFILTSDVALFEATFGADTTTLVHFFVAATPASK